MLSPPQSPKRTPPPPSPPPLQSRHHSPDPDFRHEKPNPIAIIDARPPPPPPNSHYAYSPSPFYENRWGPPTLTPAVFHHHHPHHPPPPRPDPDIDPRLQDMPHRVETERPASRRADDRGPYDMGHSHPTPPPITTLHHSPAVSVAHSISTPSPPAQPYYQHPSAPPHPGQQYGYAHQQQMNGRYPGEPMAPPMHPPYAVPSHTAPPGQANYVIYTNDAATKLSDRVRRKCYNCDTTDTSTWRRSSLTPGKVLCNKCGLFERTHSRPRPDQFPHKRGPMVTSTFKPANARSSPPPPGSPGRLPPIPNPQHMQSLPPHHYDHPSIAPLMNRVDSQNGYPSPQPNGSLPEIRTLLNSPHSTPSGINGASTSSSNGPSSHMEGGGVGPSSSSSSSQPQADGPVQIPEQIIGQKRPISPSAETPPSRSPRGEQQQQRSPSYNYKATPTA
ncbi:hypothetical protein ABKN59_009440 [Abortiporus biennis]